MKKFLTTKRLFILLLGILFSILILGNNVQATTIEETNTKLDEILNTEDKIMKYDARTNETTEVDMEELEQVLLTRNIAKNTTSIAGYTPYTSSKMYLPKLEPISVTSATSVQRITNTSIYPYKMTCRVKAYDRVVNDGNAIYGTASIVGPRAALTCAHMVFNEDNSNAVYLNWTLYPGYNNGTYYGTACGWDTVYYSSTWMQTHNYEYDWAICVLQSDVGNQIGTLGVQSYGSNSEMNNLSVTALGYPGDTNYGFYRDARYQYKTGEKITSVRDLSFRYSAKTYQGFSGGPIIRNSDNYIVGVHYGGNGTEGAGVRITQNMINIILSLNS